MIMKKMIFKISAIILCLMLALSVIGCNEKDTDNGGDDDDNGAETVEIYALKYKGTTITLGKKADSVLKKLGDPISSQNTGNCGGMGETVRYEYSALSVVVVEYEDGDAVIDALIVKNDAVTTTKGIMIGSEKAEVIEAYGEADKNTDTLVSYSKGGKTLAFGIENGVVSKIELRVVG